MTHDIRLVGGPVEAIHPLLARALVTHEPPYFCGQHEGVFVHYERTGPAEFTYLGLCREVDHGGADPHDHADAEA